MVAKGGVLVVSTGKYTGRSPNDKFIVTEPSSQDKIWWGPVNRSIEQEKFDSLLARVTSHLEERELFVQECFVGADPHYRVPVIVVTETAWHNLFAANMFLVAPADKLDEIEPEFTVLMPLASRLFLKGTVPTLKHLSS